MKKNVICSIKKLSVDFPIRDGVFQHIVGTVKAVDEVSLEIYKGEIFGLVGESGCGKTTLGRALVHLTKPTGGEIIYNEKNLLGKENIGKQEVFNKVQMIFQNSKASLNPRQTIGKMLEEVLSIRMNVKKNEMGDRIQKLLALVGLSLETVTRFPHELSGGQCQRAAIARAIALKPSFLVCDEVVSALDMSIQSQILNLLVDLKEEEDLTYFFVSHDLQVVNYLCDRVAVMYLGRIVEISNNEELFENPLHPYTKALLDSALSLEEDVEILQGEVPIENEVSQGCRFYERCPMANSRCKMEEPQLKEYGNGHKVACHFV